MRNGKASAALILALVAVALSLASAGGVGYLLFFREDPFSKGLSKYDFSTPAGALKSSLQMEADNDIKAALQYEHKTRKKEFDEILQTLEVKKEAEWGGKKILFVTFKHNGVPTFAIRGFEKHADSGYWVKTDVPLARIREDNGDLAVAMEKWERSGELDEKSANSSKVATTQTTRAFPTTESKAMRFETKAETRLMETRKQ
jgi:hypothetical protein